MKRFLKILLLAVLTVTCCFVLSCSAHTSRDINIRGYTQIRGATESWYIDTYNGYSCISPSVEQEENGSYIVTFIFSAN